MSSKKDTTQPSRAHSESTLATSAFVVGGCVALTTLGGILPSGVTRFDSVILLVAVATGILAWNALRGTSELGLDAWTPRLALALGSAVLGSALLSVQPWTSLTGPVSGTGALGIVLVLGVAILSAAGEYPWWRVLGVVGPAVLGMQVALVTAQIVLGERPTGSPNSAVLAGIVALSLPLTLAPAVSDRREPWRWALGAAGVLVLAAARSATGLSVALVVLALAAYVALRGDAKVAKGRTWQVLAGLATVTLAAVWLFGRRVGMLLDMDRALGSRPGLWEAAVEVWRTSPFVGVGPEGYRVAVAVGADEAFLREGASALGFGSLPGDPHNIVLAVLAALGLVGTVLLGALAVFVVRRWVSVGAARDGQTRWLLVAVIAYGVVLLVQPATMQTLPLAALVLGVSLVGDPAPDRLGRAVIVGIASLVIVAGVFAGAVSATRLYVGRIDLPGRAAAERASTAADLWSIDPMLHYVAAWRRYEVALVGGAGDWDVAVVHATRAADVEPSEPVFVLNRAVTLDGAGAPDGDVREAFASAIEAFPLSAEAHASYAAYLLETGAVSEARDEIEKALAVTDDSVWIHGLASQVYRALGDDAAASEHAARANELQRE